MGVGARLPHLLGSSPAAPPAPGAHPHLSLRNQVAAGASPPGSWRVKSAALINARTSHQDRGWSQPSPGLWPHPGCSLGLGWQVTPPGVWAPRYHTGNAGRVLAQQHDQARINCRKLNGKDKNTHIKKTNPSSLACLWMPATVFVIFINFPSCLMSSDNYHSQAINTPLMVSS